jgi:hypothetical protein
MKLSSRISTRLLVWFVYLGTSICASALTTNDAIQTVNHAMNSMGTGGILPNYSTHNNNSGFNAIFIRWMTRFVNNQGLQSTYPITVTNAVDPNYNISYVPGTLTVVAPPQMGGLSVSGTQLIFSYLSIAGETYQLQSTTNLSSGVWVPVSSVTGTSATVSTTNSINLVQQFFRLSITP